MKVIIAILIFFLAYVITVQGLARFLSLIADDRNHLCQVIQGSEKPIKAEKSSPDWYCRFRTIHLKKNIVAFQINTDEYLSWITRDDREIIVAESESINSHSIFELSKLPNNLITLKADNNKYWSRIDRSPGHDPIETMKESVDDASQFQVVVNQVSFVTASLWSHLVLNPVVTLRADNGNYLSRVGYTYTDYIEAVKATPDASCEFRAIRIEEHKYAFVADNGEYLRVMTDSTGELSLIASGTEIYLSSQFQGHLLEDDRVALKAVNGLFLSRNTFISRIRADKIDIDYYSTFTMSIVRFE